MATRPIALLVLLLAFCCAGCLETDKQYVINPDGTGKVMVEETTPNIDWMFAPDGGSRSKKDAPRAFAASVVGQSVGVELWKDVSYRSLPDGRIYFKGTAYFRDLNAVKFGVLSNTDITLTPIGGEQVVLEVSGPRGMGDDSEPDPRTDAEIADDADSMRIAYDGMRELIAGLESIHERISYRLAGRVQESAGFSTDSAGALTIDFDGKKIMRVLDSATATEGFWRRVAAPSTGDGRDRAMVATLFGGALPRAVVRTGNAPLFDYEAEVKAAARQYRALRKKLGVK